MDSEKEKIYEYTSYRFGAIAAGAIPIEMSQWLAAQDAKRADTAASEPAPACSCLVSDVRTDGIYCQNCGRKLCGFNVEPATQYIDAAQMLALKERTAPILQHANEELLEQIRALKQQNAALMVEKNAAERTAAINFEEWQKAEATIEALRQELQGRYGFNETVY